MDLPERHEINYLNCLPLEILDLIFNKIDNNSLLKLSQTSKQFYKMILRRQKIYDRFVLKIDYFASWNNSEGRDESQTLAIKRSKRKFQSLVVIGLRRIQERQHLSELIKAFYKNIKHLKLILCEISQSAQVALFKLMPSLEVAQLKRNVFESEHVAELPSFYKLKELRGDISFLHQNIYQKSKSLVHLEGKFSNLSFLWTLENLKVLILRMCEPDENFDEVPDKIDFELVELLIGAPIRTEFRRFSRLIDSQPKLKKLETLDFLYLAHSDLFRIFTMDLEHLSFALKEDEHLDPTIFKNNCSIFQLELKHWSTSLEITEQFIGKFKRLKILTIHIEGDYESGCNLSQLRHLDTIKIYADNHRSTIAKHFELPNLYFLSIGTLTVLEWQNLVKNNPNINHLVVETASVPMDVLQSIVNLKNLSTLQITAHQNPSELDSESIRLILSDCNCLKNLTMKNLIGFEVDYKNVLLEFKEKLKFMKCKLVYSNFARVRKSRKPKFLIF